MLPAFSRLSTNACLKPRSHRIKAAAASYRSPSYSHSTFGVQEPRRKDSVVARWGRWCNHGNFLDWLLRGSREVHGRTLTKPGIFPALPDSWRSSRRPRSGIHRIRQFQRMSNGVVERSQPVYPHPLQAQYSGTGDSQRPRSFEAFDPSTR